MKYSLFIDSFFFPFSRCRWIRSYTPFERFHSVIQVFSLVGESADPLLFFIISLQDPCLSFVPSFLSFLGRALMRKSQKSLLLKWLRLEAR